MNQILHMKNREDDNIPISQKYNNTTKNKKTVRLSFFLLFMTFLPLLFISMNIYASANKEKTSQNDIMNNISKTDEEISNVIEEQEDILPTIFDNNIGDEDIEGNFQSEAVNNSNNSVTYTTSDGKSYDVIATLNIPSLGIEYPVLSSTSTELLKVALNKYWGADPNQVGNMVIVGHNYKNSDFFSKLPQIQKGSIVKITDISGKTLDYEVYETDVIDPYDNSCTSQLTNGHTEITLITCYNNGTQRFIAKARAN